MFWILLSYGILGFGTRGGYDLWPRFLRSLWCLFFPAHALLIWLWGRRWWAKSALGRALAWIWGLIACPWTWLILWGVWWYFGSPSLEELFSGGWFGE